ACRHGHAAVVCKLSLIDRKEAAGGRDTIDSAFDQLICRALEGFQQADVVQLGNTRGDSLFHNAVLDGKWEGLRVSHVAPETAKAALHHQDADGNAVVGLLALHEGARHRSEEHTSELQSRENLVCRLLLE